MSAARSGRLVAASLAAVLLAAMPAVSGAQQPHNSKIGLNDQN